MSRSYALNWLNHNRSMIEVSYSPSSYHLFVLSGACYDMIRVCMSLLVVVVI